MKRSWTCFFLFIVTFVTLSCGSSSQSRHLQSITVSQTVSGHQVQFVATGTFSAPPTTVTPLAADWMLGMPAPPPNQWTYTLTTQPYVYDCANLNPVNPGQVTAFAPTDPSAPGSGTTKKVVTATLAFSCQ
ncbi:MAG TPA: hypothetical protein VMU05_13550 [Dongiaceae bacterium]|nr:hypothetical protein [Dongiaceae bacterium]